MDFSIFPRYKHPEVKDQDEIEDAKEARQQVKIAS